MSKHSEQGDELIREVCGLRQAFLDAFAQYAGCRMTPAHAEKAFYSAAEKPEPLRAAYAAFAARRNELMGYHIGAVNDLANKYARNGEREDLIQAGMLGFMRAVMSYTPEMGTKLVTYAWRCIKHSMLQWIYEEARARRTRRFSDLGHGDEGKFEDVLGAPDISRSRFEDAYDARELLSRLAPRHREIISAHYGLERKSQTLVEIGRSRGISKQAVFQAKSKALKKIRRKTRETSAIAS